MNDQAAFLSAVIAQPDDDNVRLVFADWLQDHGQEERAEFIRAMIREPHFTVVYDEAAGLVPDTPDRRVACHLLRRNGHKWLGPYYEAASGRQWLWRRGFVDVVVCAAADWIAEGDAIRASHPVTRVRLTTPPDVDHFGFSSDDEVTCQLRGRTAETPWNPDEPLREIALRLLAMEWPGVEFDIPT